MIAGTAFESSRAEMVAMPSPFDRAISLSPREREYAVMFKNGFCPKMGAHPLESRVDEIGFRTWGPIGKLKRVSILATQPTLVRP